MTSKNKKLNFLLIIFLLCSASLTAQEIAAKEFSWQAVITNVPRNGFYNILLGPGLISGSQAPGYTDFRIYQDKKTEVPYLLKKEAMHYDIASIKSFAVIENKQVTNGTSSFIFSNATSQPINYVTLMVKNSWVSKSMNVTGSNDLKQWYGLVPDFFFDPTKPQINLPNTDYKYIRLLINDSSSAPLNITGAGQYYNEQKSTSPLPVPSSGINIRHANKTTIIKLAFPKKYVIDNLSFNITAPTLYKRQAWVDGESFTLTSGQSNEVVLAHEVKTDTLEIRIDNQDNPPLKIEDVNAWQLPRYMAAYLEQGKSYLILTGNANLTAPEYDLTYFADSLNKELPLISIPNEQMKYINNPKPSPAKGFTLFTSQVWIWIAIVGIIALLGFMALRMLKEMQEKK